MENILISFLSKFTDYPFTVKLEGKEYQIGRGKPEFIVDFKKPISKAALFTSFKTPDDTLYQAQVNKVDYILQKLNLKEGLTLLDIGCGWGYLLIEAAKKYKIKGVGITLSTEQCNEFKKRIEQEKLQDYLRAEIMDYRDLPKSGLAFDRVVSVGMVEHVGRPNYQLFIDCVDKVLNTGGIFLLHFISALKEHAGDPWIKKYIFPGGTVPSLREVVASMAEDDFHILYFSVQLCSTL